MEAALVDICYRPLRVAWAIHSADKEGLCHIAVRRVAKIRASRNNQTGATAVRHVSIAAARST
jgi:hypothetical protein